MKRTSLVFFTFFLMFLSFKNVYSENIRIMDEYDHPSVRQYILWRVYTQAPESDVKIYMTVDSVLKGEKDFYADKKWRVGGTKYSSKINLNPNTYYLVLADALCDTPNKVCMLFFFEGDYALPDTPENRVFLSQKWNETKVIYKNLKPRPRVKGRDIDM
jgi:hypothetical protein